MSERKEEEDFDPRCSNPGNCTCYFCPSELFENCESKWNPEECCHECDEGSE